MPIDSRHSDYIKYAPAWQLCRDLSEGEDAVKRQGEKYLPKLSGQSDIDYQKYLNRASLYGAFSRTIDGLVGMVGRKSPQNEIDGSIKSLLSNIDNAGTSLDEFALKVIREAIEIGRGGVLVEFPTVMDGTTVAEAEREQKRPYAAYYTAESILDWRTEKQRNPSLTFVKLYEPIMVESGDPWVRTATYQYRVLYLENSIYHQDVFNANGTLIESIVPMVDGKNLSFIPFIPIFDIEVRKPPMIDLAKLNISHFRNSADYENGLHWIGVPTPIFVGQFADTGADGAEVQEVQLGASTGIHLQEGGSASFLEFHGSGLEGNLGKAMDRKANEMAILGAKMLETEKKSAESYDTVAIRRQEETAILAHITTDVSEMLQKMLAYMDIYYGGKSKIIYWLNTDYLPKPVDGNMVREMVAAWQAGGFSTEEFFEFMQAGEVIRSDKTVSEHIDEVMNDDVRNGLMAKAALLIAKQKAASSPPADTQKAQAAV